jgi:hypothetical protein
MVGIGVAGLDGVSLDYGGLDRDRPINAFKTPF